MKNKLVFNKKNYLIMGVGLLTIVIGFALMSGGGSDDPTKFSYEIFSFRRITLAPILVMGGYGIVLFGILKKTSFDTETDDTVKKLEEDNPLLED